MASCPLPCRLGSMGKPARKDAQPRFQSVARNPICCNFCLPILRSLTRHQRSGEESQCPAELVKKVILKGAENGGLFVGGRMYRVDISGATCEQGFVRFLEPENSRHRNANGVPVRSLRKAALTRSSTSTKLCSHRKKTASRSSSKHHAGSNISVNANVNLLNPERLMNGSAS